MKRTVENPRVLQLPLAEGTFLQGYNVLVSAGLTHEIPFSIGDIAADICLLHLQVQGPPSIGPGPKLQFALLHIKREPAYIDVAGALEYAYVSVGNDQRIEMEPTERGSKYTAVPKARYHPKVLLYLFRQTEVPPHPLIFPFAKISSAAHPKFNCLFILKHSASLCYMRLFL
jgi:hypothetical protein